MYYCQSCPEPTPMEPASDLARCPSCGRTDRATRRSVFMITGASGSGKTTIFAPLAEQLSGRCAVFDADWLLDSTQAMTGATSMSEIPWDGFWDAWLSVAHGVAQSGLATALLGPATPGRFEEPPLASGSARSTGSCSTVPTTFARRGSKPVPPGEAAMSTRRSASVDGSATTWPSRSTRIKSAPRRRLRRLQDGSLGG